MGEVQTSKEVRTFEGHSNGINAVALSPDESLIVSGGLDKTLRLWNALWWHVPRDVEATKGQGNQRH
jgi:WD40 repeat protein